MFYINVDVLQTGATTVVVVNRGSTFLNAVFGQRSYFVTCVRSGQRGKSDRKLERLWESFRINRKKDAFTIFSNDPVRPNAEVCFTQTF